MICWWKIYDKIETWYIEDKIAEILKIYKQTIDGEDASWGYFYEVDNEILSRLHLNNVRL